MCEVCGMLLEENKRLRDALANAEELRKEFNRELLPCDRPFAYATSGGTLTHCLQRAQFVANRTRKKLLALYARELHSEN